MKRQWERLEGPKLRLPSLYSPDAFRAEVSVLVGDDGEISLDFDCGYDKFPEVPVSDLLWLLKEAGFRIED